MQRRLILIAENHGKGYKPLKYSNRPFQVERVSSRQRLKVLGHAGSSKKVPWPWLERDKHRVALASREGPQEVEKE